MSRSGQSADSPRGSSEHTESQAVVAELFIAAAEVWRMTLAKIEIERIMRDERAENERNAAALETMCSRASSRAATPMPADDDADDEQVPSGGGPSDAPRRASISMARRHQRRRSSIQALANTSFLAMDDETKALLSENNSMVGSTVASRRGSRSPSPAPLADEEDPPVGLFTIRPSSSRPVSARLAQSLLVHVGPRASSPMLSVAPQDVEPPPTFLASFTFGSANPVQPQTEKTISATADEVSQAPAVSKEDVIEEPSASPLPRIATSIPPKKGFANMASKVAAALRFKGIGSSLRFADAAPPQPQHALAGSVKLHDTRVDSSSHGEDSSSNNGKLAKSSTSKSLRSGAQHKAFRKQEPKDSNLHRPSRWDDAGVDDNDEESIRQQYKRPEEVTSTEEALASYKTQQLIQESLSLSPQQYSKIAVAIVRAGHGLRRSESRLSTVPKDVDGNLLSMSHKPVNAEVLESQIKDEVDDWKVKGRAAAHAKALEVAKKYVTHGNRTNLQKYVDFMKGTWAPKPLPPQSPKQHHQHAQSRRASQTLFQSGYVAFGGSEPTESTHSPHPSASPVGHTPSAVSPAAVSPTPKPSSDGSPISPRQRDEGAIASLVTTTTVNHTSATIMSQYPGSFSFGTMNILPTVPPNTQPHIIGGDAAHHLPLLNLRTVGSLPKWAPAWNELESTIIEPLPTPKTAHAPTTAEGTANTTVTQHSRGHHSQSTSGSSSKPTSQHPNGDTPSSSPSKQHDEQHPLGEGSHSGGATTNVDSSHSGHHNHNDAQHEDMSHIVFLKSSSNHLIDVREKVYIRVWTSRREAKKFVRGMAAVTQALHTLHLPTCMACPYTVLVNVERAVVSVTWLPPMRSEQAIRILDRTNRVNLIRYMMRAVDCALVIGGDGSSPAVDDVLESLRRPDERRALVSLTSTFEGVDGRYYMFYTGLRNPSSEETNSNSTSVVSPRGSYGSSAAAGRRTPKARDSSSPRSFGNKSFGSSGASSPVEKRKPLEGPIWAAVDQRIVPLTSSLDPTCRVAMDSSRVVAALTEDPSSASDNVDLESTAVLGATGILNGSRSAATSPRPGGGGGSRRDSDFSPRSTAASPRSTPSFPPLPPFELEYAVTKQLFTEVTEELKWLQSLHKRPIGVPAANVPGSVTAYHGLLMFLSSTLFVGGSLIAPTTTPMQTPMKLLRDAVKNTLKYVETLTKEDTPSAILLYCFLGDMLPLSTIAHTKRIAKKISNVSRMQENLQEWEADAHAMEHIAMNLCLHMVEERGKLMVDVAEMWSQDDDTLIRSSTSRAPAPPSLGAEESAKERFMRSARRGGGGGIGSSISPTNRRKLYKPSVPNPTATLEELKVAMSDVSAVWGTCVAGSLYRLAYSRTIALFHKVVVQMVLPDHQHTAVDEGGSPTTTSSASSPNGDIHVPTAPPRRPIRDPEGETDPALRTEREMHRGMPIARGVLAPLILSIELRHNAILQVPSDIHGLTYHDRATSRAPSRQATGGIRDQLVMEYHSMKLYTEATDGLREREGRPIVDVVTLAGWLLAYAPLLLPERLVAVTKVCRLLRGEDDDSLRLLGKALAISVASAFSVVDLRSSKLMRCIAMAQKSMLIVGSVDMSLVDMALRPLDGEDVSMMLNVLCEDVKRIAGGVFSATKWSDHQINAFRTLRHIMRSNSQGIRGNSVFSMNERLEGLADFRLTVHDAEDQMVLDHNASVVIPASSLPPIRIPAPPPPPPAVPSTINALPAAAATTTDADPRALRDGFSFHARPASISPAFLTGSSMFNTGFVFGEQEGEDNSTTTGISGAATTVTPPTGASLMSPFGVAHDDSTAAFFHGTTGPRAESRESWSAFGRFASSGSVVSQSMLGTNSVSIATTTQSASGLRVTAATSFDATGTGSLLSPSGPSLPKIGSTAYSSARTIAKKRSVMLLNVDPLPLPSPRGDVVGMSESSPKAEVLLPALGAPHHRDTSPVPVEFRSHSGFKAEPRGGGSSRGKMSISRRSSLPRAPSPIIVIPVSLGPTDSLVALLDPTSHESPMLFSPAIPGWSEDTDPKALVDFSASITREPLNMSTRADKTRVRSLSILSLTPQQVNNNETSDDAPPGLNSSSLRHSTSMSLSTRLLRDTLVDNEVTARTSLWEEEVDEWLVISIQCDMNQQYLEDTFGVRFAVEKVATPPPLVVQSLDEGELAPTDVTPASPSIETLLSEMEFVDEVVGRTEVEVYERMEFAPLLAEYTKSLMRAALRGVGDPERKSKKRIAGVAHLRVKGNRGQNAADTMM